ncbi:MAG: hypothetical protein K0S94_2656 [Nitrospira sp.]|nr:hypothetical protein [Nitrospira sp.]
MVFQCRRALNKIVAGNGRYYVAPHLRSGGISEKDPFFLTTSPSRSKIGQEAYDRFLCEPSLKGITLDECSRPDRYLSLIFHIVTYGRCSCIYAEKACAS